MGQGFAGNMEVTLIKSTDLKPGYVIGSMVGKEGKTRYVMHIVTEVERVVGGANLRDVMVSSQTFGKPRETHRDRYPAAKVVDLYAKISTAAATTWVPVSATSVIGSELSLDKLEEQHIRALLGTGKDLGEVAKILGINQITLYRRRQKYGLADKKDVE